MPTRVISRRAALKGFGVSVGLPFLEAMLPRAAAAAPAAGKPPTRMAFLYIPNGVIPAKWKPEAEGADYQLSPTLEPLEPFKKDVLVLGGLTCDKARSNGDGPGDHARAMAAFLTGAQAKKTGGADFQAGVSVDQLAAQKVGAATRFPSLELGCEYGRQVGICDSGYSCVYSNNLSWRSAATPAPKEVHPRLVFDRLFAGGGARESSDAAAQREVYNQSILDFVSEEAGALKKQLGAADLRRMDEYLTSVRDVEKRLTQPPAELPDAVKKLMARPTGIPLGFREHFRLMADLLALAFQADLTRISTVVFGVEGSRRSFPEIDVTDEHHGISHHQNNPKMVDQHFRINKFHVGELAYFLGKLKGIKEGDGTLLDNCMVMYGGGNADGNRHTHHDLPLVLAGKGGGTIKPGRHVVYPKDTPVANLYLAMLDRMGVKADKFGDSTGVLESLS
ncbi:DUF1552 domain-containing protein [Limnoglobus roseus]|uniref:DUF1552 domain-containing protein n=1 Tax=Limnoglobus roseus TaxID=2598579 RepID=A0A5C1A701_9BACT|nr:DUF1552 domain-containing protein [Limnoglobus roseus]QEL14971.1 hypothetical protein PX52LOC_01876 [Limnoglobus roseus]